MTGRKPKRFTAFLWHRRIGLIALVLVAILALLIGLAVLILVSPGLIGRLAERSSDENIRVGTVENDEVVVSAQVFQRGWFTTEGEHRIEFKDGAFAGQYRALLGLAPDAPLPALIINTRVDHGVIPVSSMGREHGSLRPGLGDAISTLRIELPDGEAFRLAIQQGLTATNGSVLPVDVIRRFATRSP